MIYDIPRKIDNPIDRVTAENLYGKKNAGIVKPPVSTGNIMSLSHKSSSAQPNTKSNAKAKGNGQHSAQVRSLRAKSGKSLIAAVYVLIKLSFALVGIRLILTAN